MNEKLQAAREERGWTQEDVAGMISANCRTYRRWERGEACPQFANQDKLCRLFEKTPVQLGFAEAEL